MKVIRESYRAGESWPFFVTLERGEEIRGYFRVNYDALLALADEMDMDAKAALVREWSDPTLAIMGHALADEYAANARRIREACGMVDAG